MTPTPGEEEAIEELRQNAVQEALQFPPTGVSPEAWALVCARITTRVAVSGAILAIPPVGWVWKYAETSGGVARTLVRARAHTPAQTAASRRNWAHALVKGVIGSLTVYGRYLDPENQALVNEALDKLKLVVKNFERGVV